ncbi:NEL-type E3 ubiquitin ligase domain-containing protein, partial [Candidatus Regiella insecticola]|uniref:NEL-type E3 ubiquitin ligase domain-containing protein n=1 Tax=Candidatus Regiella insecticola TaxID=138073 RepID=UPI00031B53DC
MQLSSAVKKMRFLGAAGVTPDDLEIAMLNVKHRENSEFPAWLSRWSPWETVLERLYNSPYQSAMAQLHDE